MHEYYIFRGIYLQILDDILLIDHVSPLKTSQIFHRKVLPFVVYMVFLSRLTCCIALWVLVITRYFIKS